MWPFVKLKTAEAKEIEKKLADVDERIKDLHRKLNALDTDMSLFWDKLNKAIARKAVKKIEEEEAKDLNEGVLLPDTYGNASTNLGRKR